MHVLVRPALGQPGLDPAGEPTADRPLLFAFGAGAVLLFNGPVRPRIGLGVQFAPNPDGIGSGTEDAPRFLAGFAGSAGVDIPLGSSPVALRAAAGVGNLGPFFVLRGTVPVVVNLGSMD